MVVCGPTAGGKSRLADEISRHTTDALSEWTPTLVVDSMQVYREIPVITNQGRERPAELVGITSVADEWTMARHRRAADEVLASTEGPFVLDAGTGMYLNALLLDIDVAPRVSRRLRGEAEEASIGAANPRRAARERELALAGAPDRGSIWSGALRYDAELVYLRPDREALYSVIGLRSKKIARDGIEEAVRLHALAERGLGPNPSVMASIGVRELMEVVSGRLSPAEAVDRISIRTRRLVRRQTTWFDKLVRVLQGRTRVTVVRRVEDLPPLNTMFDILGS